MATEIPTQLDKSPPSEEEEGARDKEKLIPVFTVLKNNSILKNIFVIDSPPSSSDSPVVSSGDFEEVLLVGRHPDCNITLEHPSISRFHLRIHSVPSRQSLSVIDLSSVHGTWVSGKKVEPGVQVELREGDLLNLGGSTRGYRLHWVPLSRAYDMKNPFVPPLVEESIDRMQVEARPQLEDEGLHVTDDGNETEGDSFEGFDLLFSDMNMMSPMQQLGAPSMLENGNVPCYIEEDLEESSFEKPLQLSEIAETQPVWELDDENGLNKSSFPETLQPSEITETQPVLKLGEENRILESTLLICANGLNNSDVPPCEEPEPVKVQKEERSPILVDDGLSFQDVKTEELAECHDDLEKLFADILVADISNVISPLKQFTPSTSLVLKSSIPFETAGVTPSLKLDEVNSEQQLDFVDVQAFPQAEDIQSSPVASPINPSFGIWEQNPALQLHEANIELPVPLASADVHMPPQRENVGSPPLVSRVRSNSSIWKRRGKSASVQVRTDKSRQKRSEACCTGLELGMESNESIRSKSHLRGLIEGAGSTEEVFFTPYEEIRDPEPLLLSKVLKEQDSEEISNELRLKSLLSSTDDEEESEAAYTPDKENMTPNTHLLYYRKKMGKLDDINPPKSYSRSSPLKNFGPNACTEVCMPVLSKSHNRSKNVLGEKTRDCSGPSSLAKSEGGILKVREHRMPFQSPLLNSHKTTYERGKGKGGLNLNSLFSSTDEEGEEAFTPDKENMSPSTYLLLSKTKMEMLEEHNRPKLYRSSPLKNVGQNTCTEAFMSVLSESCNHSSKVHQETTCDSSGSNSLAKLEGDILKATEQRMPFQSALANSNKTKSEAVEVGGTSSGYESSVDMQVKDPIHPFKNSSKGEIKRWTMVVDTACLLNKESRKALQLMQGVRGTSLIIPRIVIRELDCMSKHCSFFRRNTEVSSALQWIKDCMMETKWWIHVQSSVEDRDPIPPTPRSWPSVGEEKEKFSASSAPFSPFGTFEDIVTPTTEDHILEYALFLIEMQQTEGRVVLLSDDVSLKIKAMAEGLLCETAKEFRESLVCPLSERFLWTDSSPRGPTWCCRDEVPLRKNMQLDERAKGLKLILLHNSKHAKRFFCQNMSGRHRDRHDDIQAGRIRLTGDFEYSRPILAKTLALKEAATLTDSVTYLKYVS